MGFCSICREGLTTLKSNGNWSERPRAHQIRDNLDFDKASNHFFPPKGHQVLSHIQNYPSCQYYLMWKDFVDWSDQQTVKMIWLQLVQRILKCLKFPPACFSFPYKCFKSLPACLGSMVVPKPRISNPNKPQRPSRKSVSSLVTFYWVSIMLCPSCIIYP